MAQRRVAGTGTFSAMARHIGTVEIEDGGKKYTASYTVEKGIITVSDPLRGTKTTQLGGMATAAEVLARQLLRELVRETPNP